MATIKDIGDWVDDAFSAAEQLQSVEPDKLREFATKAFIALQQQQTWTKFLPARYRKLAQYAVNAAALASMLGIGYGARHVTDKPDTISVTVPAEVQATIAATDAKLADVTKQLETASAKIAANEEAAKEQAARMQAAAEETKKVVAELNAKRWITYGKTKDGASVPLLEFGGK